MEDLDHPVIITTLSIPAKGNVTIHGNYIWQHPNERSWFLGSFRRLHMFDKAIPGEY